MLIGDWSSNRYVTVFTETGENLLSENLETDLFIHFLKI